MVQGGRAFISDSLPAVPPEDGLIDRGLWKSCFASGYAEKFDVGFYCSWHVAYGRNGHEKQPLGPKNEKEVNPQS